MPEQLGKPTHSDEQQIPGLQVVPDSPSVDLRVLQANERTLLAWIRTGLTVMAFGFVVERIGIWLRGMNADGATGSWSGWIGSAFVLLGTVSNATAALRYLRVRRGIIEGRVSHTGNAAVLFLAFGIVVLGGILLAYLLVR